MKGNNLLRWWQSINGDGKKNNSKPGSGGDRDAFPVTESSYKWVGSQSGAQRCAIAHIAGYPFRYRFCVYAKSFEDDEMSEATASNSPAIALILRCTKDPLKLRLAHNLFNLPPSHWFEIIAIGGRGEVQLCYQGVRLVGSNFDADSTASFILNGLLKIAVGLEHLPGSSEPRSPYRGSLLYATFDTRLFWANGILSLMLGRALQEQQRRDRLGL